MFIAISSFIILVCVLLEVTFIPLPLTLLALIFFGIYQRRPWIFFLAVFSGLLLDGLTFRLLGVSSLFFLIMIGALFLYSRKFETHHIFFGTLFVTLASVVYLLIFVHDHVIFSLGSIILLSIVFSVFLHLFLSRWPGKV